MQMSPFRPRLARDRAVVRARRASALFGGLAAALAAGALLAAPAEASTTRVFSPVAQTSQKLVFRVTGLRAAQVRTARLVLGGRSQRLSSAAVRRGARRGIVRVRLPGRWRRLAGRAARRTPKLVVRTGSRASLQPSSRPIMPASAPPAPPIVPTPPPIVSTPPPSAPATPAVAAPAANPLAGAKLYVDPDSNARRTADSWRASRPLDAAQMDKIAARSQADWFGDWNANVQAAVDARVTAIAAAGALPVLVAYNIPQRDCGGHSGGGASGAAGYRTWIRQFAAGIGSRRAVVILEPDALAAIDCLAPADQELRLDLLADAVRVLAGHDRVATYIDAGHSGWRPAPQMASRLAAVAVSKAQGFSLNVSNYRWTADEQSYGRSISAALGAKHFVIDTSRNGLGPSADSQWCNAAGRALGPSPTVRTHEPLADAYLWIKRPGESDGACNGGPPPGAWWPEYALGLAQRAGF